MERSPFAFDREPHYSIDDSARQLKMPPRALVARIDDGKVEVKFNGHRNYISAGEIRRVSVELRREAKAAQEAEDERKAEEQREEDGAYIAREMSHLQELAARYGFVPDGKD